MDLTNDKYHKKHEKDESAIFGKISVLIEFEQYDEALKLIDSVPSKYRKYLESELFIANGQIQNAIDILDSILKDDENNINIILRKARVYYDNLKFNEALMVLDSVLKIDSSNIEALQLKGEILAGLHKYDSAISTMSNIPSEHLSQGHANLVDYLKNLTGKNSGFYGVLEQESFWEYIYVETNIFKRIKAQYFDELKFKTIKRGLPWKCIDKLLQMKTISKNELKHSVEEEFLYNLIQDDDYPNVLKISNATIKKFDKYLKSDSHNYKVFNNKGYVLLNLEKIDDAMECFEKALNINIDDFHAWFNKGVAYLKHGNYYNAKECFLKFLNLNEDNSNYFKKSIGKYFYDLGESLFENENYIDSIHCYDISFEFNSEFQDYFNCKAISLEYLGRFDEALEFFSKALKIKPHEVIQNNKKNCYKNKIDYLLKNEDYIHTIECCNDALKEFPDESNFYNCYAISLEYLGRFDEALEFFSKALKINPHDDVLQNNKINCYYGKIEDLFKSEDFTSIIECCNTALNEFSNESALYGYKVISLNKIGKFDDAFICCTAALKEFPNDAQLYGCKGICLEKMGKFDEAIECYDKSLKIEHNEYILKNKMLCYENKKNI